MDIYKEWLEVNHTLDSIKKKELRLRNEIIELKTKKGEYGIFKMKQGKFNLTINRGIRSTIDEAVLDTIYDEFTEEEKAVLLYKPSLIQKEFKMLKGDEKIFDAIIQKPSQPTLKILVDE